MRTRLVLVAMLVAAAASHGFAGDSGAASDPELALSEQIRALQARIAALESADEGGTLDEQRQEAVRALIAQTLRDADHRASLLDQPFTAGHDGRFFITHHDRRFRLDVGGQFQVRYVHNSRSPGSGDDHRSGFELRRTQLLFQGYAIDPRLTYKVQGQFDRTNGVLTLLDAEVGWIISDGWSVRAGQFRPGFLREDSTSSTRQMAVERSLVNNRFAQNRMQGIELRGQVLEQLRISGMVSDGLRSRNTPWELPTVEYAFTGRAEWLAAGSWSQFRQFTSPIGERFGVLLGGAIHWQRAEFGTMESNRLDMIRWTIDGQLSLPGASIFTAFVASHEDLRGGGNALRWGAIAQGSVYLLDRWELFARYEHGDVDEGTDPRLSIVTTGFNWYVDGHRLKLTTDVGIAFRPVSDAWAATSAGWRTDSPGKKGQIVLRSQFQLLF